MLDVTVQKSNYNHPGHRGPLEDLALDSLERPSMVIIVLYGFSAIHNSEAFMTAQKTPNTQPLTSKGTPRKINPPQDA
jgi:hypothetical protein